MKKPLEYAIEYEIHDCRWDKPAKSCILPPRDMTESEVIARCKEEITRWLDGSRLKEGLDSIKSYRVYGMWKQVDDTTMKRDIIWEFKMEEWE